MDQAPTIFPTADHDLLIEVGANVKNMATTLQNYTAANSRTTQDHENRIRALEADNQILKGSQRSLKLVLSSVSIIAAAASAIATFLALN